jgi:hypothetical protein
MATPEGLLRAIAKDEKKLVQRCECEFYDRNVCDFEFANFKGVWRELVRAAELAKIGHLEHTRSDPTARGLTPWALPWPYRKK